MVVQALHGLTIVTRIHLQICLNSTIFFWIRPSSRLFCN